MTVKHFRIDSGAMEDTDANVLEWVNKYAEALKSCKDKIIFMRTPLEIQRGVKEFGTTAVFAKVYARWTAVDDLTPHSSSCSNQNVLDPLGAYVGVEECGCRADKSFPPIANGNDTPNAIRRVVMSWFP